MRTLQEGCLTLRAQACAGMLCSCNCCRSSRTTIRLFAAHCFFHSGMEFTECEDPGVQHVVRTCSLSDEEKDCVLVSKVPRTQRACRLTVNILQGSNLKKKGSRPEAREPAFKVRVEHVQQRSREVKKSAESNGDLAVNQCFTFDVKDPKSAELSVKVVGRGLLGMDASLGRIKPKSVADLLDEQTDSSSSTPKWYDLYSKDGGHLMPGKVLLHITAGIAEPEHSISVFVGTWNVGNARPPKDLSAWVPANSIHEIVAVGAQECDYQARHPFTECSKDWLHTLSSHLGVRYSLVHMNSRGQMRLAIFVRDDAKKAISDVSSGSEATGVGHVIANKGGVCVGFKFWDTGLCFVNSHLAAHVGHCEARNGHYREIAGQLKVGMSNMDILNQYHHVFWFGDLNYRLDFGDMVDKSATQQTFWKEVVTDIHSGQYKKLLQYDELGKENRAGRVLYGFSEGEITFTPTFKMQRDTVDTYDQKRMPAWCDRVLLRTLPGCTAKLLTYVSSPSILTSDHKPVAATFSLTAYALPSSISPTDDKRWHIQFTSLRAKKLRASDINGFSDPYVSFVGPNLIQEFHSKVKYQTLNPVWNPLEELPVLVLNIFPLQRLEREYLFVRVRDRDYTSADDTLGYAVIPLAQAVLHFKSGSHESTHFRLALTHRGLPAGTLEGGMQLTWEKNIMKRGMSIGSHFGRTMSLKFKKHGHREIPSSSVV